MALIMFSPDQGLLLLQCNTSMAHSMRSHLRLRSCMGVSLIPLPAIGIWIKTQLAESRQIHQSEVTPFPQAMS